MTGGPDATGAHGVYEVRLSGLLGPLLLDALPHASACHEARHTLVVTVARDGDQLLGLLREIVERGVEVVSVREINEPA